MTDATGEFSCRGVSRARIVRDVDEIGALEQQPGRAVSVVGGPGLVANLVNADLLDELRRSPAGSDGGHGGQRPVPAVSEPIP
jgi:hypothetical protein